MVRHLNALYLSVLILLSVVLWIPRLKGPLDLRYDAGVYYILGTSLAQGKGYRLLNEPGEIQAIQYPPGLPLFAAAHQLVARSTDPAVVGHWLRLSFAVLFICSIVAVYLLSRRFLTPGFAFLVALVSLLHVHTTWLSDLFFAELPFTLTSLLFLLLVGRRGKTGSREWFAGALGGISFLLRSTAIALLAAWVGESLVRRRVRVTAIRAGLALIPVFGWLAYMSHVKGGHEYGHSAYPYQRAAYQYYNVGYLENIMYVDPFVPELGKVSPKLMVKRVGRNLASIPVSLGEAVSVRAEWSILGLEHVNEEISPVPVPLWLVDVALGLLGAIIVGGLLLLALRGEWPIPLYMAGSIALICLTPWPGQFERYLAPLTPLLALALFVALVALRKHLSHVERKWGRLAGTLILIVVIGTIGQEVIALYAVHTKQYPQTFFEDQRGRRQQYRLFFYSDSWVPHDAALDWLKGKAKTGEIVATSTPHWAYLKTGLRAVMPPFEADVREAQRLIDSVPVRYLIVDNLEFVDISRRYAAPVVEVFADRWALIYSTGEGGSRIYRRVDRADKTILLPHRRASAVHTRGSKRANCSP